jgi:cardiolipin synthase
MPADGDRSWDSERIYFSGDEFFSDLLAEIAQAKISIDVESYIFNRDEFATEIEIALSAAARRGVKVRLLVDGFGALNWIGHWLPRLLESGVELRIYHPMPKSLLGQIWNFRGIRKVFIKINKRNHRKVWIIDKNIAWVSSMNITGVHLERFMRERAWRDTGVRVTGTEISLLELAFEQAWLRAQTPDGKSYWLERFRFRRFPKETLVRLNFTRRLRARAHSDLRKKLKSASQRIWITNPYFAPSSRFLAVLVDAHRRGVDVRVLVPRQSDVFFMHWVATYFYGPLLRGGVQIFEYLPSFLHAKSIVIDQWATVGTSNLNSRSFRHDLEVDIVLNNVEVHQRLEEQFLKDLSQSEEITLQYYRHQVWMGLVGRFLSFLFGNWI